MRGGMGSVGGGRSPAASPKKSRLAYASPCEARMAVSSAGKWSQSRPPACTGHVCQPTSRTTRHWPPGAGGDPHAQRTSCCRHLPAGQPGDAELLTDVGRHPVRRDPLRQERHQLGDLRAPTGAHNRAPAPEHVHARDQALRLGPEDDRARPGRAVGLERRAAHVLGAVAVGDLVLERRLGDAVMHPQGEVAAAEHHQHDQDDAQEPHVGPHGVPHRRGRRRRPPGTGRHRTRSRCGARRTGDGAGRNRLRHGIAHGLEVLVGSSSSGSKSSSSSGSKSSSSSGSASVRACLGR